MTSEVLAIAQIVSSILTAAAVFFAFLQVRQSTIQTKKQTDAGAIEFVLLSEGQIDGMAEALLAQDALVIREIYAREIDPAWSDAELKSFVFLNRYYGHISRMVYLLGDRTLDIGMSAAEREDFLQPWVAGLMRYRQHKIMRRIHENGQQFKNYNDRMLRLSREVFENSAKHDDGGESP